MWLHMCPGPRLLSEVIDKGPQEVPGPALSQQGHRMTEEDLQKLPEPGHWDFGDWSCLSRNRGSDGVKDKARLEGRPGETQAWTWEAVGGAFAEEEGGGWGPPTFLLSKCPYGSRSPSLRVLTWPPLQPHCLTPSDPVPAQA